MPFPQYSYAFCHKTHTRLLLHSFCCTFYGMATCTASSTTYIFLSSSQRGHFLYLCPFSPYLKHSITQPFSSVSCLLSSTPYLITLQRLWGEAKDRDIKVDCISLSNGRYVPFYTRMNTTKIFCELVEEWNYIAKWKTMGLFREPYGCVHLHDLTCLLISKNILHTLLLNTSNLFWEITFPFSSFPLFLQFQTRCLNFLQLKHNFPFLPSSSSLNLEREHFYLSKLLINELYCS